MGSVQTQVVHLLRFGGRGKGCGIVSVRLLRLLRSNEQHGGVKEFFPLTIHFSGGRSGNLLGVHRLLDPAQNTQLPHSQGLEGFPERLRGLMSKLSR